MNDAARIMCRVTRSGGKYADIEARYRVICADPGRPQRAAEEAMALEMAMQNTQANMAELDEAFRLFQLINALLNTLSLLFVALPIGRTVRGSVVALRTAVGAREQAIQVQQAANQRTFQILQREAANAAAFRMRAGE